MNLKLLVLATVVVLACTAARAQVYLGAGFGQAYLKSTGAFNVKDHASGRKAFIGYNFFKFFGVEVPLIDFGSTEGQEHRGVMTTSDSAGFGAFAVGKVPIAFFEPFVKVGYVHVYSKIFFGTLGEYEPSSSGLAYGGGVGFNFAKHLHIRAEYERFDISPNFAGVEPDTDLYMISASVAWRF